MGYIQIMGYLTLGLNICIKKTKIKKKSLRSSQECQNNPFRPYYTSILVFILNLYPEFIILISNSPRTGLLTLNIILYNL